ncbi:MAG: beta-lactamase family protein [Actinomycetota bacterium]|jgi:D-alanyl-D-alanine carboxypeptidase|nr:beta-lactamase family protein [Actinomycetota bacterium]
MRKSGRRTALSLVAALTLVATVAWASDTGARRRDPPYARALQPKLEQLVKDMLVPGAVVVVRSEELGNWSTKFGTRTLGDKRPIGIDDHVRIGSNTKTMTGTVILQLVQEGKLRLDDPVSKFRPDVPNGENITVEQLMDMRSGLYNYSDSLELNQALDTNPKRVWTPDELLAMALAHPPYFPPGEGYHYTNTNFVLLGMIIDRLTADSLDHAFQERIFKPLGLDNTSLPKRHSKAIPEPHPQGYMFGTNVSTLDSQVLPADQQAEASAGTFKPSNVTNERPSWAWAAGGAISTTDDLARYVRALVGGGLLHEDLQRQRLDSMQPVDPTNPTSPSYGLALAKLGPLFGHTGEIPGFQSFMGYDPVRKIAVVVWTTLPAAPDGTAPASAMAKTIIGELYPEPPPTPEDENP